jgi:hypothetical protein
MIGSVVGSLASSMELARSFLIEENNSVAVETNDDVTDDSQGVEVFAQVIDAVMSRFRVIFTDTVIRLENPVDSNAELMSAIELQIDR